jgi:hypothetical protein
MLPWMVVQRQPCSSVTINPSSLPIVVLWHASGGLVSFADWGLAPDRDSCSIPASPPALHSLTEPGLVYDLEVVAGTLGACTLKGMNLPHPQGLA